MNAMDCPDTILPIHRKSTVFTAVGINAPVSERQRDPSSVLHPQPRVLEEIEVFVDDVEMLLLLGGEDLEDRLLLPVRGVVGHAGVHLPPLGLESEGLPHRNSGCLLYTSDAADDLL